MEEFGLIADGLELRKCILELRKCIFKKFSEDTAEFKNGYLKALDDVIAILRETFRRETEKELKELLGDKDG